MDLLAPSIPGNFCVASVPIATTLLPHPRGGIGVADFDGNGITDFLALTEGPTGGFGPLLVHGTEIDMHDSRLFIEPGLLQNSHFTALDNTQHDQVAVGFGVGHTDTDGTLDYVMAYTTTGANLVVDIFSAATGAELTATPIELFGNMGVVDRNREDANFLGFTTMDDDQDGIVELAVLHRTGTPLVSIFRADGTHVRTITLELDPIIAAQARKPRDRTTVGGFARFSFDEAEEWFVVTQGHSLLNGELSGGLPEMDLFYWRFDDVGNAINPLGDVLLGQISDSSAVVVGIAGLPRTCTNCMDSNVCAADTDGDSLFDVWEEEGVDRNCDGVVNQVDGDVPLHLWANKLKKDIFVELDWMEFEEPTRAAVLAVKDAFAKAPVSNPDGSTGINLWIDTGSLRDPQHQEDFALSGWNTCDDGIDNGTVEILPRPADGADEADPECLQLVGDDLGGGSEVPFDANDVISGALEVSADIKPIHLLPGREGIFRYMLSARPALRLRAKATDRPTVSDVRLHEDLDPADGTCDATPFTGPFLA